MAGWTQKTGEVNRAASRGLARAGIETSELQLVAPREAMVSNGVARTAMTRHGRRQWSGVGPSG